MWPNYIIRVETIRPKQIIAHKHGIGECGPIMGKGMSRGPKGQPRQAGVAGPAAVSLALIIPNPKLKLLDQVREVMRLRHYSIRTEQCYCDWIRRFIKFHQMRSRDELLGGGGKVESFLSDLAVNGHVSASTQNQAIRPG